ncbi:hypothetical protein TNCV_4327271 [Trichonephila clavipes]|nr:hypothetical protein TNCV_4327271 [Trichonephila clavipes]
MVERSKALRSGRSPLVWAWFSLIKGKETLSHVSRWPSGLRRCVQVAVHFCGRGMAKRSKAQRSCRSPLGFGVGSNPTSDNVSIQSFFEFKELNARERYFACQDGRTV